MVDEEQLDRAVWHIASCLAQKEKQALSLITDEGIAAHCPMVKVHRVYRNRTRYTREILMFPNYLFIEIPEKIPDMRKWREYGVECLLTWPHGIPDGAMWAIVRAERELNERANRLISDVQQYGSRRKATARVVKAIGKQRQYLSKDGVWEWLERQLVHAGPERGLGVLMQLLSKTMVLPQRLAVQGAA